MEGEARQPEGRPAGETVRREGESPERQHGAAARERLDGGRISKRRDAEAEEASRLGLSPGTAPAARGRARVGCGAASMGGCRGHRVPPREPSERPWTRHYWQAGP